MVFDFDVIVVGAGHAGCEAAHAAGRMGARVLLVTLDPTKMALMSCNPAVGGIAKGQIVREVDALGGMMGRVTDETSIQFRMLNMSKGPAVWSPRSQCDKYLFSLRWRQKLEANENVSVWADAVTGLVVEGDTVKGVRTRLGVVFRAGAVVLTAGTFLNGLIHIGRVSYSGGRMGDEASTGIAEQLREAGVSVGRMKTGTPVRIDGRTIDFGCLERQEGNLSGHRFSYAPPLEGGGLPQMPCYVTYTSPEVHEILRSGFADSPLYNGTIRSIGPRYCPSIETKLVNFADKDRHQLFIEPEGVGTVEYYLNGFSSSLPWEVQFEALRHVRGLERAVMIRPGYAIEYDYFDPTQLEHSLESKVLKGLFMAGQVNGTTGYEEAAGQGLMAGVNAVLKVRGEGSFVLSRDEAYIGVLIDDLVTKGVDEPYRMFTSRAEYRILLRQDNADDRLTPKGRVLGLATAEAESRHGLKVSVREELIGLLERKLLRTEVVNPILERCGSSAVSESQRASQLLLRPQVSLEDLLPVLPEAKRILGRAPEDLRGEVVESAEILVKYGGYIAKERQAADRLLRQGSVRLRGRVDYSQVTALSYEAREKLRRIDPLTIDQAARIPGVSPSDISVLMVLLNG